MFVKIKELPKDLKKKALKRMIEQRGLADDSTVVAAAFDFSKTKEGMDYWSDVCNAYGDALTLENFYDMLERDASVVLSVDGIKVKEPQVVKLDPIVESVVNQLRDRSEVGIKKYGTTLDDNNLSIKEWIEHAKQEAMDFVLYLEKLKTTL
jgi:uncharacterized protein YbjQ (UPF0145 family)